VFKPSVLASMLFGVGMMMTSPSPAKADSVANVSGTADRPVFYRTVKVDGLSIFYREAGKPDAPTILLLHGFPSSSRMYDSLLSRLSDQYHLVAPDYPGFGHSDAPDAKDFSYTFDHLTEVTGHFIEAIGLKHYVLYVQDYGGPIGMRLAVQHPERVDALIIQNAVSHEDGLGPLWETRRAFWKDRTAHEAALRENFLSLASTRQRHVGSNPHPETINPDLWTDEFAFLSRPGEADIQTDLFYSYQTNVASYPAWQAWLKKHQPKTLIVWGKYDPSFQVAEVAAYQRDLPDAEVHVLDAGHFALDEKPNEIAAIMRRFLAGLPAAH
jgi:pimeloyl-ACP methyl ester carboxylesterase